MTDVASLALRVDALEVNAAAESLKKLQRAGEDAESKLTGSVSSMVAGFQKAAGAALALYGTFQTIAGATKDFVAFDKTLGEIRTQLLDAKSSAEDFANASQKLALTFGSKLTDQSKAFYEILSTGITDATEATELLTIANKLAIGGNSDLQTTISGLTAIVKGYGDKVKDVSEVSDTLFTASLAGNISIQELSEGLGRIIPLAEALDVSLEEVTGSISALTLTGVSARESITSVRAVLAALVKPSKEASDEAERLGLQFNAAAIQSKGMVGFLDDLKEKTGGSATSLGLLFGGVEAILPALNLVKNAGREFNGIMDQMAEKAGITDRAFNEMAETADFKINRFFAAMNVISKELGGTLASILTPAAEGAANALARLFKNQNLTDIQRQEKAVDDLASKIERMRGINAVLPFENLIYNKRELDQAEHDLDVAKEKLEELKKAKDELAEPPKENTQPPLKPNDPPTGGGGGSKTKREAISESEQFIKSLQNEARESGVTGTALLELRAKYLGVSESAQPLIDKIKQADGAMIAQRDSAAQLTRDMEKIKQMTNEVKTAEEKFIDTQNELNRLLSTGRLDPEVYFRQLEKAGDDMQKSLLDGNEQFKQLTFAAQGFGRAATDAFVDFATGGKASFNDFAEQVLKDILRMYVQLQLINPLLQALPSFSGAAGSGAGAASSGAFSNIFKGFRASGGPVAGNSLYRVNENGLPELFSQGGKQFLLTTDQGGYVSPMQQSRSSGRSGGIGGSGVVVNLIESPGKGGSTQQRQTSNGVEIDVMVDQLVAKKQTQRSSASNKALRQNFGLTDSLIMR